VLPVFPLNARCRSVCTLMLEVYYRYSVVHQK